MRGAVTGVVHSLFAMTFFVWMTSAVSRWADALNLLIWKVYAMAVLSERSCLASCIQKANALTLLIQKVYAVATASECSRLASCVRMCGTMANCI